MPVVRRSTRITVTGLVPPATLSKLLADGARRARDDAIASGQAVPSYQTFVDGREGASEDTVRPDGAILYKFNVLGLAAAYGLAFAQGRSPVRSGAYKRAWFVAVAGQVWTGALNDIPPGAEVMITNRQPYHRKIDTGGMKVSVPRYIVEDTRQAIRRRFPTLIVSRALVNIPGNYVLKGHHSKKRGPRRDTRKGELLTYPAVVLNQKR